MFKYKVKQGDCIHSIAYKNGFYWKTLWNHADNSTLKEERKVPGVLCPGDTLVIPDITKKSEDAATDTKHSFTAKNNATKVRIKMQLGEELLANEKYQIDVEGVLLEGSTDGDGILEFSVLPITKKVVVNLIDRKMKMPLSVGAMNPPSDEKGLQARLKNLGYNPGKEDGQLGDKSTKAIIRFQRANNLDETGKFDEDTKSAIKDQYDY